MTQGAGSGWLCLGRAGVCWGVLKAASSIRGSLSDSRLVLSGAPSRLLRLHSRMHGTLMGNAEETEGCTDVEHA